MADKKLVLKQAKIFLGKKKYAKCRELLEKIAGEEPDASVLSMLSKCEAGAGDLAKAEEYAKKAAELSPGSADALAAMAGVQSAQGKHKQAAEAYKKALEESPSEELRKSLAAELEAAGEKKAALEQYKKIGEAEKAEELEQEISPKRKTKALPEIAEVSHKYFFTKIPEGWSLIEEEEQKVYILQKNGRPEFNVMITPFIELSNEELMDFKNGFYAMVEEQVRKRPAKMASRKMTLGDAKEAMLTVEEDGQLVRKMVVGYPYGNDFYWLIFSAPESEFASSEPGFDLILGSFLPRGMTPQKAESILSSKPSASKPSSLLSMKAELALSAVGALLIAGVLVDLLMGLNGLIAGTKGILLEVLLLPLGLLLTVGLVVRVKREYSFMLSLLIMVLSGLAGALAYSMMNAPSVAFVGSAASGLVLTGALAEIGVLLVIILAAGLMVLGGAVFMLAQTKKLDLIENALSRF